MTSRDPERSNSWHTLWTNKLENSWRCYLTTIANYYIFCYEAVRSAILATAWLLVEVRRSIIIYCWACTITQRIRR